MDIYKPPKWLKCLVILVLFALPIARPAHTDALAERAAGSELSSPLMPIKLAKALRGTTRQAERIAEAIEAREIKVEILRTAGFYKRYRLLDGQRSAQAFAHCSVVFLRADSPTILSDLVHEGTHALDCLSGRDMSRRRLELRAYLYEHQYQKAARDHPQFGSPLQVVWFMWRRY